MVTSLEISKENLADQASEPGSLHGMMCIKLWQWKCRGESQKAEVITTQDMYLHPPWKSAKNMLGEPGKAEDINMLIQSNHGGSVQTSS